jgi:tetratricopeptide (TPR) repeat protein
MRKISMMLTFSFLLLAGTLIGQSDCSNNLETAKRLFEDGYPQLIPDLLEGCQKSRLPKEKHIEILQLLAEAYLEMNNGKQAEEYYLKILEINPDYRPDLDKSPELYYLAEELERTPYLMFSFKGGIGLVDVNRERDYFIGSVNTQLGAAVSAEEYDSNFESFFHGAVEFNLFKTNFDLSIGVDYSSYSYDYMGGLSFSNHPEYVTVNLTFKEKQKWFGAPILIRYNFKGGSFLGKDSRPERTYTPYFYIGVSPQWLLSARIDDPDITATNFMGSILEGPTTTGFDLNTDQYPEMRRSSNLSILTGAGVKRKIGSIYVFAELSLVSMTSNVSNVENKLASDLPVGSPVQRLRDEFLYVEDNFRMNRLNLSLGFTYSFYRLLRYSYKIKQ